ncbi:hypothetical protein [Brevibacillus laterosporus]|uniref:hypothetical protein n=1 Tax=Brevibacillus laterosporus TaxID=1465 RepID=UPI003D22F11B
MGYISAKKANKLAGEGKFKGRPLYIACEDYDFIWLESEIDEVRQLWREHESIASIAKKIKRDIDEVTLLIIDQIRHGMIRKRKGSLLEHVS